MRAAGASRIVALVKEDIRTEVQAFREGYWNGEVFQDEEMEFFKALGGGRPNAPYGPVGFMTMLVNPFSKSRTKEHLKEVKQLKIEGNTTGEGFITGGVYVIRPDGTAAYSFLEQEIGDKAPIADVIAAVKAAAKGSEVPAPKGQTEGTSQASGREVQCEGETCRVIGAGGG